MTIARALIVLLLALALAPASADVNTTIAKLRHEPMSLFDWGLFLMEDEIQSVRRHEKDFIRVFYEPDRQQIVIDGVFVVERGEIDAITAERACYTRLHAIKLTLGIIDTTKINIAPASEFRLGTKFSHHNSDAFPELPDAEGIGAELLKSIYVRVGIVSNLREFPFQQDMRCEGALLNQEVQYGGKVVPDAHSGQCCR